MILISKNVYIDVLDNTVIKFKTYHSTIKMKPVDVKSSTYINCSNDINDTDPTFDISDIVRISKLKTFVQKAMFKIGLKEFL